MTEAFRRSEINREPEEIQPTKRVRKFVQITPQATVDETVTQKEKSFWERIFFGDGV